MKTNLTLIIACTLCLISCKKEEKHQTLFLSSVGTEWVYVTSFADTVIWELTDELKINNESILEVSMFSNVTNRYYYKQDDNRIYKYAQYVPRHSIPYPSDLPIDLDTLIVFSEPSLEFVLEGPTGYNWHRKILTAHLNGYSEEEVYMELISQERIETPAGVYRCTVIRDEADILYYVADEGLIKTTSEVAVGDTTVQVSQILIEKK